MSGVSGDHAGLLAAGALGGRAADRAMGRLGRTVTLGGGFVLVGLGIGAAGPHGRMYRILAWGTMPLGARSSGAMAAAFDTLRASGIGPAVDIALVPVPRHEPRAISTRQE